MRGAVSIGRRLMDPLAELVKIDAKDLSNNLQSKPNNGKYKITGNVADNNGEPIIGASVVISAQRTEP